MDEFSFIDYLKKIVPRGRRVAVGIGDDAAVLSVDKGKQLVVSTDAIVENVDFVIKASGKSPLLRAERSNLRDRHAPAGFAMTALLSPEKIGRKALAINLSDIAAMGAKPVAFVITIGKPKHISEAWLKRFYSGLLALAKKYDVACVGGDLSGSREFFANVTIFGEAAPKKIAKRSGAEPGDRIAVTGSLGGSILRHQYDFEPRVKEGQFLAGESFVSSMIDISDGLIQDLTHILKASKAGASLDLAHIPVSSDAKKMAKGNSREALEHALSDGEDFELLFTVPYRKKTKLDKLWKKRFPQAPLTWIGKIEKGTPRIFWRRDGKAIMTPKLRKKGFSHF